MSKSSGKKRRVVEAEKEDAGDPVTDILDKAFGHFVPALVLESSKPEILKKKKQKNKKKS